MDLGALVKKEKPTNQQILEKAIQKAIDNGWEHEKITTWRDGYGVQKFKSLERLKEFDVENIIFSSQFAKALWQDPDYGTWHHHLQQMVIADDPIKYLGDYLDG